MCIPYTFRCLLTYLFTYVLTYLLTPLSRVLREKLIGSQPVKKFPLFYETGGSLPHSHVPATYSYHEPARSSQVPTSHFLKIHLNIILSFSPVKWVPGLSRG